MATTKEDFLALRQENGALATAQQREAANPQYSVWVQASAGTGKTKVLSDRVLQLLLHEVNPMRILCLTYTKAAAVEMNTRISERLSEWAVAADADLEENLQALLGKETADVQVLQKYKLRARKLFAVLLDTPGGLKIQTIHSFCQEVLKRFPLEAGVTPYFSVMDDSEAQKAMERIRHDMINDAEAAPQSSLGQAVRYMAAHLKEKAFAQVMAQIVENLPRLGERDKHWAEDDYARVLAQKLQVKPQQSADDLMAELMAGVDKTARKADVAAWRKSGQQDQDRADRMQALLDSGLTADNAQAYIDFFIKYDSKLQDFKINTLANKNAAAVDAELMPRLQAEAERVLAYNQKIKATMLYEATVQALNIARELNERYAAYKRQTEQFDYGDLIALTKRLLSSSSVADWVLYKLDGGIDHILVDEAQDTSADQWQIIQSLSAEFFAGLGGKNKQATVFAVGDRKQSIFSFQGANPQKFDEMAHYFAERASATQKDFRRVDLKVSFRSAAAVLNTVNQVFARPEANAGVVADGEKVNHIAFRAGEFGHVEVWPLLMPAKDKSENADDIWHPEAEMSREVSVRTMMAKQIVDKIKQLYDESQKTERPLKYRDFMVLVQKRSSIVTEFIRACKKIGVAVSGADKLKLSQQIAVQDLISLGRFLLLTNDDLALAEVLKSPLFGLTDDDLMTLCYNRGQTPLWTKLGDYPQYGAVYAELQMLLNMCDLVRPYELFNYVLSKMNGRFKFTERMGMEVEDALDEFMNLALNYEQKNIPSLQGFMQWLTQNEVEVKRETEQKDTDAVRMMTVHGSKGLQAPIVFLPDTVSIKANKRERMFLWDNDMVYYPLGSAYYENICMKLRQKVYDKDMEEYRRLLYVALTRAEDRLYVCGFAKRPPKAESWYNLCRDGMAADGATASETLICETPEILPKKSKTSAAMILQQQALPQWAKEDAETEQNLARPYTPSKPEDEDDYDSASPLDEQGDFYRRGTLIHKLLQFLPAQAENKAALVHEFLARNAADMAPHRRAQIEDEVLTLINQPQFADVFGEHSRAEVPIMGEVDGKIISAQIDRLVELDDKMLIIDFKTNRPAAKTLATTPPSYIKQLQIYAELVRRIYPQKSVESYILWTNETRLMRIL